MGIFKNLNEMLVLGQFQARDKEQVDEMLDHLVGSYGYTYTWLISCPLVVLIFALFGFFVVATNAPFLIGAVLVLLALLIAVFSIDMIHGRLIVTGEKVVRQSPFRFFGWELERKGIAAIVYSAAQRQGEWVCFENADGTKRTIQLHGSFKERFIGFVPKAQRGWGSE